MSGFDVCVIGGGPGGYVAAIRASQLGLSTCLIERDALGGVCLNWGCIPTKALLKSAEVYNYVKKAKDYGVVLHSSPSADIKAMVERSRAVSGKLSGGVAGLMKKNKIEVVSGKAVFGSKSSISVFDKNDKKFAEISSKYFILATGARARVISGFEPDGNLILTYKEAMVQNEVPKRLLVVGSGAIGIEFAYFFNSIGSDVTVIEMLDRIVPTEDAEISKLAEKSFSSLGIKIQTSSSLVKFVKDKNFVKVTYKAKDGSEITQEFDKVIMATGVVPNSDGIGLEKTKIELDKGTVKTNNYLETSESSIYAIGDVTYGPWLAHKASHEGVIAAEHIASKLGKYSLSKIHTIKKSNIPGCIYTNPQIASVGLTEVKAKELGYKLKIGRFPYQANGKAIAIGKTEGLIKTIFDEKTGELLGVHMIGADVTEFISSMVVGKQMEATELDFMETIFPHPTLSEMVHESVLEAFGRVIHI